MGNDQEAVGQLVFKSETQAEEFASLRNYFLYRLQQSQLANKLQLNNTFLQVASHLQLGVQEGKPALREIFDVVEVLYRLNIIGVVESIYTSVVRHAEGQTDEIARITNAAFRLDLDPEMLPQMRESELEIRSAALVAFRDYIGQLLPESENIGLADVIVTQLLLKANGGLANQTVIQAAERLLNPASAFIIEGVEMDEPAGLDDQPSLGFLQRLFAGLQLPALPGGIYAPASAVVAVVLATQMLMPAETAKAESIALTLTDYFPNLTSDQISDLYEIIVNPAKTIEYQFGEAENVVLERLSTISLAEVISNLPQSSTLNTWDHGSQDISYISLDQGEELTMQAILARLVDVSPLAEGESSLQAALPVARNGVLVTSNPFNNVNERLYPGSSHNGIDIDAPRGEPYFSMLPGGVYLGTGSFGEEQGGLGPAAVVMRHDLDLTDHDGNKLFLFAVYGHGDADPQIQNLPPNTILPAGVKLGTVSSNGNSTGPHLHITLMVGHANTVAHGEGGFSVSGRRLVIDPTDFWTALQGAKSEVSVQPEETSVHTLTDQVTYADEEGAGVVYLGRSIRIESWIAESQRSRKQIMEGLFEQVFAETNYDYNFCLNLLSDLLYADGDNFVYAEDLAAALDMIAKAFPEGRDTTAEELNPLRARGMRQIILAQIGSEADNPQAVLTAFNDAIAAGLFDDEQTFAGLDIDQQVADQLGDLSDWPIRQSFSDYLSLHPSLEEKMFPPGEIGNMRRNFVTIVHDSVFGGDALFPQDWDGVADRAEYLYYLWEMANLGYQEGQTSYASCTNPLQFFRIGVMERLRGAHIMNLSLEELEAKVTLWRQESAEWANFVPTLPAEALTQGNMTNIQAILNSWPIEMAFSYWASNLDLEANPGLPKEVKDPLFYSLVGDLGMDEFFIDPWEVSDELGGSRSYFNRRAEALAKGFDLYSAAMGTIPNIPGPTQTRWHYVLEFAVAQKRSFELEDQIKRLWELLVAESTSYESAKTEFDSLATTSSWPIDMPIEDLLQNKLRVPEGEELVVYENWKRVIAGYINQMVGSYPSAETLFTTQEDGTLWSIEQDREFWNNRQTRFDQVMELVNFAMPEGEFTHDQTTDYVQAEISRLIFQMLNTPEELPEGVQSWEDVHTKMKERLAAQAQERNATGEVIATDQLVASWPVAQDFGSFATSDKAPEEIKKLTPLQVGIINGYIQQALNLELQGSLDTDAEMLLRSERFRYAYDLVLTVFPLGEDERSTTTSFTRWRWQSLYYNTYQNPGADIGQFLQSIEAEKSLLLEGELPAGLLAPTWPVNQEFTNYFDAGADESLITQIQNLGLMSVGRPVVKGVNDYLAESGIYNLRNMETISDQEFLVQRDLELREAIIYTLILNAPDDDIFATKAGNTSSRSAVLQYSYNVGSPSQVLLRFCPWLANPEITAENIFAVFGEWKTHLSAQENGGEFFDINVSDPSSMDAVTSFNPSLSNTSAGG